MTPIERVIDALADHHCAPRRAGNEWSARCPCTDNHRRGDRNPSLRVREGDRQAVVACCHRGCNTDQIMAALGLTIHDLFEPRTPTERTNGADETRALRALIAPSEPPPADTPRRITATYNYQHADGQLAFQVVRYEPKTFRQRQPDGNGGWTWNLRSIDQPPLYHLPDVLDAVRNGTTIWIAEGEKDVDTLRTLGLAATCNPMGAGKWRDWHTQTLTGAAAVRIIADNDDPGIDHASHVARTLTEHGIPVTLLAPANGYRDATDHLAADHGLDELRVVDWAPTADDSAPADIVPTTWAPVDLTDALAGIDIPPPIYMPRSDGPCLVYAGRIHWFQGEPESLKSWAALYAVADAIRRGETTLYIDFEDDARAVVSRLLALGLERGQIAAGLTYLAPEEPLIDPHGHITPAQVDFTGLLGRGYSLAVVDGVTEGMTVEGLDLLANTDIAAWLRRLPKRLSAAGMAVICVDHVTKSTEARGRWAIGGQHKLAGVTGATYSFDVVRPLSRAILEPVEASVRVTVWKDRPGHVRAHADGKTIAVMNVTSWPDGTLDIALDPPAEGEPMPDMRILRGVLQHLDTYEGASQRSVCDAVEGRMESIRSALTWMVQRGWVTVEQKGASHRHWLTDAGREEVGGV